MTIKTFFLIGCIIFINTTFCQQVPNSALLAKGFAVLEAQFNKNSLDTLRVKYANAFLQKAKNKNDAVKIADGYLLLSEFYSQTPKAISYADSCIVLSKNWKHKKYPAQGYIQKGTELYYKAHHKEALQYFVKTNTIAEQQHNYIQQITIKHYIGLLKNVNRNDKEALQIFRENLKLCKKYHLLKVNRKQYLKSLYALADSYTKNKVHDSASIYLRKGLLESYKDKYLYKYFLSGYGFNAYHTQKYREAIDTLAKSLKLYNITKKKRNIGADCVYLYLSYKKNGNKELGLDYLFKIDSIFNKGDSTIIVRARDSYFYLNEYYKSINKPKEQLNYLNKFFVTDSVIKEKFKNLDKYITHKYDTPILLNQKQFLIEKLKQKDAKRKQLITSLLVFCGTIALMMFYFAIKNYRNKKKFQNLLQQYKDNTTTKISFKEKKGQLSYKDLPVELSKEVVEDILEKLSLFETSKEYIHQKYTIIKLAKELDTNSTYLSNIINYAKGTNFSNYLNNLKIEYAIDKLTNDKEFREKYNIEGMAIACGFGNRQSFSTAFYKKTGLYPSYFVKQLVKKQEQL